MVMRTRRFGRAIPEIPQSRRFVADVLRAEGTDADDAVLLVTSELVTNAVRHGEGDVELRVIVEPGSVRLEVLDDGHAPLSAPEATPPPDSVGGRGLHLVRSIARGWGTGFDDDGRTMVWAELPAVYRPAAAG
jgi:anti-sigma regulatory factor (Ser/Thr protein kinase)